MAALNPTIDIMEFTEALKQEMQQSSLNANNTLYTAFLENIAIRSFQTLNAYSNRPDPVQSTAAAPAHFGTLSNFPYGFTCVPFPTTYTPLSFCSGVVDYSFLLASGETEDTLEQAARNAALYMNPFLDTGCLSDYKRLICASVYLRCVDNG